MGVRIYAHFDDETGERPSYTLPLGLVRPEDVQFGTVKKQLIEKYNGLFPPSCALDYNALCFYTEENCPIPDSSAVPTYASEHNDFFLRALPEHDNVQHGELASSQKKKGELSYYYAHDRKNRSLVAKPQGIQVVPTPAPAPKPVPPPATATSASSMAQMYTKANSRQSPFGTDVSKYETIAEYSWEDHDSETVKVFIPLEGVGKLPTEKIKSRFGIRQFELLVDDYEGKNLRFACSKTHSEMDAEECKHVVRANRINLVIRKAKEKDIWFDLFKKRAIGDDDPP